MLRPFAVLSGVLALAATAMACGGSEAVEEPPVTRTSAATADAVTEDAEPTVLDLIHSDPRFESLARLVDEGPQIFRGKMAEASWNHTVLAPTEEAFAALPAGTVERLIDEDQGAVHAILDNLLFNETVPTDALRDGGKYQTFKDVLPVRIVGDEIRIGQTTIVEADIEASNGLIHAIDQVPIPPFYRERVLGSGE